MEILITIMELLFSLLFFIEDNFVIMVVIFIILFLVITNISPHKSRGEDLDQLYDDLNESLQKEWDSMSPEERSARLAEVERESRRKKEYNRLHNKDGSKDMRRKENRLDR